MKLAANQAPWLIIFAWFALSPFWILHESLWIDEAGSAVKVLAKNPSDVWRELVTEKNSNLHLPFYHYYLWACSKLLGQSEFALRLCNVPWMFLGFVFLLLGASPMAGNPPRPTWLALFLTSSPFLFYYANEVRPYAMQFGLAAAAMVGMVRTQRDDSHFLWKWSMALGTVLLAWTTVYGLAWWVIGLGFWLCQPNHKKTGYENKAVLGLLLLGGAAALLFHAWVVSQGASASPIGETSWKSLGYAMFEWTGAAGFLPGRAELRSGHLPNWAGWILPGLTTGLCLLLLTAGARAVWRASSHAVFTSIWALPVIGILGSGIFRSFRVVGRHFMPVAPCFFWFLAGGPQKAPQWHWTRLAGMVLLTLWFGSLIRLAKLPEHRKDNYRSAAQFIHQNRDTAEAVWWAADGAGARFYGLGEISVLMGPTESQLASLPKPRWVVLSKPDIYDRNAALRDYCERIRAKKVAEFQSFVIYDCGN